MLSAHLHLTVYCSLSSSLQLCISIHFKGISNSYLSSTQRCDLPLSSPLLNPLVSKISIKTTFSNLSHPPVEEHKFYPPPNFRFPTQTSHLFSPIFTTIVCPSAPRHLFVIIRHTSPHNLTSLLPTLPKISQPNCRKTR